MATKAKGVCLPITIEHDGQRYAPGMPVPLAKAEAERLIAKHGEWKGDPVTGEPVSVSRPIVSRSTPSETGGKGGNGGLSLSKADLDALLQGAAEAGAAKALEGFDEVLEQATAAAVTKVLDALTDDDGGDDAGDSDAGGASPDLLSETSEKTNAKG
jgi:hypothetical protein